MQNVVKTKQNNNQSEPNWLKHWYWWWDICLIHLNSTPIHLLKHNGTGQVRFAEPTDRLTQTSDKWVIHDQVERKSVCVFLLLLILFCKAKCVCWNGGWMDGLVLAPNVMAGLSRRHTERPRRFLATGRRTPWRRGRWWPSPSSRPCCWQWRPRCPRSRWTCRPFAWTSCAAWSPPLALLHNNKQTQAKWNQKRQQWMKVREKQREWKKYPFCASRACPSSPWRWSCRRRKRTAGGWGARRSPWRLLCTGSWRPCCRRSWWLRRRADLAKCGHCHRQHLLYLFSKHMLATDTLD